MSDINPEISLLKSKLLQHPLPLELKQKAERMLDRLSTITQSTAYSMAEIELVTKYIDWLTTIPFNSYTTDDLDLVHTKGCLDKNHYGLNAIKENILEFVATKALLEEKRKLIVTANPTNFNGVSPIMIKSPVLCFVGVQGIGKTTMAKSIAEALGRSFERIALGAFSSVYEIRGKSKSEIGAEPGQVVKALIKAKSMNPVILLDEIDKVSESSNLKADVMAALLEILDPEQNKSFVDRYIDFPIDLSQVIFITTANNLGSISSALLDRLEIIRFSSYTDDEKQVIAKNYLLPKVRIDNGISEDQLEFSEDAWPLIIRPLGFDAGIRQLERNLTQLARKVAKMIVLKQTIKVTITPTNFRKFFPDEIAVYS